MSINVTAPKFPLFFNLAKLFGRYCTAIVSFIFFILFITGILPIPAILTPVQTVVNFYNQLDGIFKFAFAMTIGLGSSSFAAFMFDVLFKIFVTCPLLDKKLSDAYSQINVLNQKLQDVEVNSHIRIDELERALRESDMEKQEMTIEWARLQSHIPGPENLASSSSSQMARSPAPFQQ